MILETGAFQGVARIVWVDRAGYLDPQRQPLADLPLEVRFSQLPRALRAVHKTGATLLLRSSGLRIAAGAPQPASWLDAGTDAYDVQGEVSEPTGRFLPRRFARLTGQTQDLAIDLYRSPLGARYQSGGGVQGRVMFDDDAPAALALIRVEVTPPLTGKLAFIAQADGNGEFRLPLDRLPALGKDAPSATYPAVLRVQASPDASRAWREQGIPANPDLYPSAQVLDMADATRFADSTSFTITPGTVATLTSAGKSTLVVQT
ncbi:MAG: hypothetical protein HZB71_03705 [Betaproteobacteria bacterium]|nr:hypothetical protein [Betaproteobacteria bacterium]